jgi:hypothetical protein
MSVTKEAIRAQLLLEKARAKMKAIQIREAKLNA